MALQQMLRAAAAGESVTIETGWAQGRATYGGVVAALMLASVKGELQRTATADQRRQPLRSMTTSFVAPAAPETPTELRARVLRRGSSATQCEVLMEQQGQVVAAALTSFGAHRESAVVVGSRGLPAELGSPDDADALPYIEGLMPEFFQHMQLKPVTGDLPYSGSTGSHMSGWMTLADTPETFTEEYLVAVADAWPPAVLQMLSEPAPASTLTWTLELLAELDGLPGETMWAYQVQTDASRDGYAHTCAHLWQPDGTLTAISRQTVAVFG